MYGPRCEYCRHYNQAGARFCEACEFPLDGDAGAGGPSARHAPGDDTPAPPFEGAGDVLSPMLAVYRKHFTLVGTLVLVAMVPEALLQFGVMGLVTPGAVLEGPGSAGIGSAARSAAPKPPSARGGWDGSTACRCVRARARSYLESGGTKTS